LLLASAHVTETADIVALPGTYGETIEGIQAYARHFHLIALEGSLSDLARNACRHRVLLLDSCIGASAFEETLNSEEPDCAFVIFDTTCFACGSGHIKRVVTWARRWQLPIVLVRSHNKLDSLGIEYGRLGSAVFVDAAGQSALRELAAEMRNAVRLLGNAALPAHFPPYVGTEAHQRLTQKRIAAIVKNSRRMSQTLAKLRDCSRGTLHFAHGLYVTLNVNRPLDEQEAKEIAADLANDLTKAGLPLRHVDPISPWTIISIGVASTSNDRGRKSVPIVWAHGLESAGDPMMFFLPSEIVMQRLGTAALRPHSVFRIH
jgi:hypothetical protein